MTSVVPPRPSRRRKVPFVAIPLLALIALICWGFASPAGSTPDEGFHLQSIWCGSGSPTPTCEDGPTAGERAISPDLVGGAICYANDSTRTPDCQGDEYGDDLSSNHILSNGGNFYGLYPPVFYFTMSLFATDNLQLSVLTMRAVNSLIFVALSTALFFLLPLHRRPTLLVSVIATLVPVGVFLIASVNPSGWAIMSAGMLWISLLGFMETNGKRRIALGAIAVLATVMSAGARADGAVYSILAIGAVLLLRAERSRRFLLLAILPLALAVMAGLFFLSAGQSNAASTGLSTARGGHSQYVLIVENLTNLPSLFMGVFGSWPLGWLDTPLPSVVPFAGTVVLGGLVMLGINWFGRRKALATAGVFAVLCLFPLVLLYQSDSIVGAQVQPRYILPVMVLLTGIILVRRRGEPLLIKPVQAVLIATAISLANAAALHANIRRYVTGVGAGGGNLDSGVEWWWDAGLSPMGVWALGAVTFAGTLFWLAHVWIRYSAVHADAFVPDRPVAGATALPSR